MGSLFPPPRPRFSELPTAPSVTPERIELRRFAGHVDHEEHLSHLRIAHLTDQHFGRVTSHNVQRAAMNLTNGQEPDLIVITGDFVCHSQEYLDELEEVIRQFKAPVVCVLGNHDHWSGAPAVRRALRRAGAEVLDNAHTLLTLRHQRLQIVGVDDAYTGHADVEKAVKGLRRDLPAIGLSHIAEEADHFWERGVPLVFSGHTHAGQVTLARMHELLLGRIVGHKYVHGLYGCRQRTQAKGAVYVGAGIGAAVVPLRLGARGRREVAMFELGATAGAEWEHHKEQPPLKGRAPDARTKERRRRQLERKMRKHPPSGE
jgi:predicted MPP superfamily phosphohydrolase